MSFPDLRPYRRGDYWLVPVRTSTGDVLWPTAGEANKPVRVGPRNRRHAYAPLLLLRPDQKPVDLRRILDPFDVFAKKT